jgi:hypothetical protein
MATAKLKRKPDSQKSNLIKLLILKKYSFASGFVSLLMGTYPAAVATKS